MKNKQTSFHLNFIGKSYYSQSSFENEAYKVGINRAVSFNVLKKLKFGEPILLASYIPSKPEGSCEVFGYFTLSGISHNLPSELSEKLLSNLTVANTVEGNGESVIRACGSYQTGSTSTIKETLEQLVAKIEEVLTNYSHEPSLTEKDVRSSEYDWCLCKDCVVNDDLEKIHQRISQCITEKCKCCTVKESLMNNFKWFITGKYTPLSHFLLKPITFARGIKTVEISNLHLEKQQKEPRNLIWLRDYKKRKYMPTYQKNSFGKTSDMEKYFK